ncbi:MAG: indole-3-glycerol phosphate synthase TrpC [Desulfomonile tiedjei]|nr:indole-3-glycerol phosphate synthase TrpC [Desulfomonile tiedjei]
MTTILYKIVQARLARLAEEQFVTSVDVLASRATETAPPLDFASAFKGPGIHVIAEIKKASPSKGLLKSNFDPKALGLAYEDGGAVAVSVLTEQDHFMGSLSALTKVRDAVSVPILRKDFIVDEYQVVETRAAGADSFLLIAGLLDAPRLRYLIERGREWQMEPLVEVHNLSELSIALESGARIIGINNRDLATFNVDIDVTLQLMKHIPSNRIVVSESGIRTREEILSLKEAGVAGFLIGESIVTSSDPAAKIRELVHGRS